MFALDIAISLVPSESGNLQLVQIKFPVFWQNLQIHCVFPDMHSTWKVLTNCVNVMVRVDLQRDEAMSQHFLAVTNLGGKAP